MDPSRVSVAVLKASGVPRHMLPAPMQHDNASDGRQRWVPPATTPSVAALCTRDVTQVRLYQATPAPAPAPAPAPTTAPAPAPATTAIKAVPQSTLLRVFRQIDDDGNGRISRHELDVALDQLGMEAPDHLKQIVLPDRGSATDIHSDDEERGGVNLEEFTATVKMVQLHQTFSAIDADGNGSVDIDELKGFLKDQGMKVPDSKVEEMLASVDEDNSATLDFEEFYKFFVHCANVDAKALANQWMLMAAVDAGSAFSAAPPPKNMSLWRFAFAGGTGGVVSRTATAPLERFKIIAQTEEAETTMSQLLRRITRVEGLRGLFVGNAANTLRVFPFGCTVGIVYTKLVEVLPTKNEFHPMEPFYRGVAGAAAGAAATVVTYPLDVVKARMSVTDSQFRTIGGTIRKIVAAQGVRGLYNGLGPSVFAVAPFLAVQQSSYDVMKQLLSPYVEPSVPLFVACGAVAGMMAQTVVHPIDLVRVRMQVSATRGKQRSAIETARRAVAKHGLQVLYNGWGAAVLKVAPAVAISLLVRDALLGRVQKEE